MGDYSVLGQGPRGAFWFEKPQKSFEKHIGSVIKTHD
tara:strand:- start:25 stop:135 length:111 start_codon:yes stop_codon:yes gene_type:complete